jgi:hypothetical protein
VKFGSKAKKKSPFEIIAVDKEKVMSMFQNC